MTMLKAWAGKPYPLGATWTGDGVNFAIFSERASAIELCLFDKIDAPREFTRIPFREQTGQVWHVFLPDARPGQLYGYRVYGGCRSAPRVGVDECEIVIDPHRKRSNRPTKQSAAMV